MMAAPSIRSHYPHRIAATLQPSIDANSADSIGPYLQVLDGNSVARDVGMLWICCVDVWMYGLRSFLAITPVEELRQC